MILVAEAALPVVQALIRWDPVTTPNGNSPTGGARLPARRADGRRERFRRGGGRILADTVLPAQAEVIGTVPAGADKVQALIRIPRPGGLALAAALRQAQAARAARKDTGQVRVQLDPADLI